MSPARVCPACREPYADRAEDLVEGRGWFVRVALYKHVPLRVCEVPMGAEFRLACSIPKAPIIHRYVEPMLWCGACGLGAIRHEQSLEVSMGRWMSRRDTWFHERSGCSRITAA